MKITAIERQKNDPSRYTIYVDNHFALGLHKNVIADFGLRKGDSVDEDLLRTLQSQDELMRAYQIALRYLSYRPRSTAEIHSRLEREQFDVSTINRTIQKLRDEGQLDDRRFAEMYAESKMLRKPIGSHRLRKELHQKGISDEIVEAVEKMYCTEERELENARHLARQRLLRDTTRDPLKRKKHLADFLLRRGYAWDVVSTVVNELTD